MKIIAITIILASSALADQWEDVQRQQEKERARQQENTDRWKAERERQESERAREQSENDRLRHEDRIRRLEDSKWRDKE